jgi:Uncharacterized protein conserved in bacteria (DUF2252)
MHGALKRRRLTRGLALAGACTVLLAGSARAQIRADFAALASAQPALVDQLRADPFTYFRFVNRPWIARVCQAFADLPAGPVVRLHGDAHVEQFAVTRDAFGLDDFDDAAHGPAFVDIVRYMGSVDLVLRERGWTHDRDRLWDRFLDGYRRGLADPTYRPREPAIVQRLRAKAPVTRAAFLTWGEAQMQPMDTDTAKALAVAMEAFGRFIGPERPDLPPGFFAVVRAGWLRMGVGSAALRKVLVRVQGLTPAGGDDVLIEGKEAGSLDGLACLEKSTEPPAIRVIDAMRQLGRLKRDILAVGPTELIPGAESRPDFLKWWVSTWESSYQELRVSDIRSSGELAAMAFDAGVQLGAGEPQDAAARKAVLSSIPSLEPRLRKETTTMVEELLTGWREMAGRGIER